MIALVHAAVVSLLAHSHDASELTRSEVPSTKRISSAAINPAGFAAGAGFIDRSHTQFVRPGFEVFGKIAELLGVIPVFASPHFDPIQLRRKLVIRREIRRTARDTFFSSVKTNVRRK